LPFIAIISTDFFDKLFFNKDKTLLISIVTPLNFILIFHWGYCIWFLFKYDRYSKSIFPLFFLNVFYAPIYFYRVKIKKIPLRNKIIEPDKQTVTENSIF